MLLLLGALPGCRPAAAEPPERWEYGRVQICQLSKRARGSGPVSMALEAKDAPPLPPQDDGVGSEWAHAADALSHLGESGWEVVAIGAPVEGCERYVLKRRR